MPLILASASLRRAELLTAAGFAFEIAPANVDESALDGEDAGTYVLRVARAKASHISKTCADADTVLAADTVVVRNGRLMGKPADDDDAASMLRALAGGVHEVHTAVVVRGGFGERSELVTTRVRFQPLTGEEIDWYIRTGEPAGKAGAYAIQGRAARFIDWIDGSWSNVVGLPISAVYRLLKDLDRVTDSGD